MQGTQQALHRSPIDAKDENTCENNEKRGGGGRRARRFVGYRDESAARPQMDSVPQAWWGPPPTAAHAWVASTRDADPHSVQRADGRHADILSKGPQPSRA